MMGNSGQHTGKSPFGSQPVRVLYPYNYLQLKLNSYVAAVINRQGYLCVRIMEILILCQNATLERKAV